MKQIPLFIAYIFIISFSAHAQLQNIPLITTEGQAVIKAKPDHVILAFKVSKGIKAVAINNDPFNIFRTEDSRIKIFDFDEKNISQSQIQIEDSMYTKEIYITINDLTKTDRILLELNKLGFIKFHYMDYRVRNLTDLQYQAKQKAVISARTKAALLAKELGQSIGRAHTIEEIYTPDYQWYNLKNDHGKENITYLYDNDDYILEPGFIIITAKVKVSFDLVK